MGWLRKKGRQLDKRVRKIFGKNAWLKVAALIGGGYMYGTGGYHLPGGGKFTQFFKDVGSSVKNFFWDKGSAGKWATSPTGSQVWIPPVKGGLTWAGQIGTSVGTSVATGMAIGKLNEQPMMGQQAGYAPQENTAINKAVAASNAAYGNVGNILDAYRNFDFGPGSTTMMVDSARNRNVRSAYFSPQIT
tara:strand:- start:337 stop:903 length:567 start_codon:yes stop_codon:yes gene_type:complete